MELTVLLERLAQSAGVSGREQPAAEVACAELERYTDDISVDAMGSVTAIIKQGSPLVLLDAHMDEIGLIVTSLGENGFSQGGGGRRCGPPAAPHAGSGHPFRRAGGGCCV